MKIGYADPPYPGCAHLYRDHPDFNGEVDHVSLIRRLCKEYDGWILHTSSTALRKLIPMIPIEARICAWVKPFAAFKKNVAVAYAWEPVIIKAGRKPVVSPWCIYRDFISEPITLRRGLVGAKPEAVCFWAFALVGANPEDEMDDLFPGTGAVTRAWNEWKSQRWLGAAAREVREG